MRHARLLAAALLAVAVAGTADAQTDYSARIARVLRATPLIDGHNDWAETLRDREGEKRWTIDLQRLPATGDNRYNTDIERLRLGLVGGQFWSVYVGANLPPLKQIRETLEQIDLVRDFIARYPATFELARTAADVRRIHRAGRIASMMGVEGGNQIAGDLSVLRAYHALGAGYLTLTHALTIDWADSATDEPKHHGLTPFGVAVVHELNRLGMLVDLSHVSEETMIAALRASRAPVIFSHSSARTLVDSPRDVSDTVLKLVAANGGVVMVNFAPGYVSEERRLWVADNRAESARNWSPPFGGLYIGQPERAKQAMVAWLAAHPQPKVTLSQVADHIEHIARVAGVDHVGLGSDFDGLGNDLPDGLGSVDAYPALLAELMRRGWSDADIAKLAGENVLRVMAGAEAVAAAMKAELPATATMEEARR